MIELESDLLSILSFHMTSWKRRGLVCEIETQRKLIRADSFQLTFLYIELKH